MKYTKRAGIILFWIALWWAAARVLQKPLVLVGPEAVVGALVRLLPTQGFWKIIGTSLLRIGCGFLGGMVCGILLGALAYGIPRLADWLQPLISLMKAVPVAAFVILALLFMGSRNLAILIVWILVTPIFYYNTLHGMKSVDPMLLEVTKVFPMTWIHKLRALYVPALRPFLSGAAQTAVGMSWKSGVAAEVIGVSLGSIGEQLYMSKVYLETADLFAWTLVIIALSAISEKCVVFLLGKLLRTPGTTGGKAQVNHAGD